MRPLLEMLLAIVALATHTSGLPYGELPPQLQTREYANGGFDRSCLPICRKQPDINSQNFHVVVHSCTPVPLLPFSTLSSSSASGKRDG